MLHRAQKITGFTVVELIVVISLIALLASIGLVSYNRVLENARNTDRINELKTWENAFTLYAKTGKGYPKVSNLNTGYCLGTGFPGNKCGVANQYSPNSALNSKLTGIMGNRNPGSDQAKQEQVSRWNGAIGPYARYTTSSGVTTITLSTVLEGKLCPPGTKLTQSFTANKRIICSVQLPQLNIEP